MSLENNRRIGPCPNCGLPPDVCVCAEICKENKRNTNFGISMICPDGKPCKIEVKKAPIGEIFVCRHGLVVKRIIDGTLICPLKLQEEYEKGKWNKFMDWYEKFRKRHPLRRLLDF